MILTGLILLGSCKNIDKDKDKAIATENHATDLSLTEKQNIEQEISAITRSFFVSVDKLDIEQCMNFFEDTKDFVAVNPDGTPADFSALKKINADGFSQLAAMKTTIRKESVRALSKSQAMYTFFAAQQLTLKTGEKMKVDNIAGSMLFEKINNTWKATFYHESAAPAVKVMI